MRCSGGTATRSQIAPLTQALSDNNPAIRAYAVSIMGEIGADAQDGVFGLVEALGDSDQRVRSNVASALVHRYKTKTKRINLVIRAAPFFVLSPHNVLVA